MAHAEISKSMMSCIDECLACYKSCLETVHHCLTLGGQHASPDHVSTLLTCAEACQASAQAMLLGSSNHAISCEACAAFCQLCAESCRSMGNDATMLRCAEVCDRCAESCKKMAGVDR